jgi:F-type H+-transporting ATPase subunit epsilon
MRLTITTPAAVVLDERDVSHVRAEDDTGEFGILHGHADFITVLSISVITFRKNTNEEHYVVVREGVLTVRNGETIEVATRQAIDEATLGRLGKAVAQQFKDEERSEGESRTSAAKLHLAAIRQIQRYLETGRNVGMQGQLPISGAAVSADEALT